MESRRVVILVVSVVLGILAALASFSYLRGAQERANSDAKLVQVYVVKKDIPKGLPGQKARDEKYIVADKINAKFRPATAVIDINAVTDKVALVALSPNQVVVDGMFVPANVAQVTNSQRIAPGLVAITVSIDGVRAVGNNLVPGDRVNIMSFATIDTTNLPKVPAGTPTPDGTPASGSPGFATAKPDAAGQHGLTLLYQNVEILAINSSFAAQPGETSAAQTPGAGNITFAVPQDAAERIILASTTTAGLYLALVPPNNPAVSIPGVSVDQLFRQPCVSLGPDGVSGTADDSPANCVPLEAVPSVTTTTTTAAP